MRVSVCFVLFAYLAGCIGAEDVLYAIGGRRGDFAPSGMQSVESSAVSTNKWSSYPSLNTGRMDAASVMIGSKIYTIGGTTYRVGFDDGEVIDTASPSPAWSVIPKMSAARSQHAAVAINGTIYVIGGNSETDSGHLNVKLNTVETFTSSSSSLSWKPFPNMTTARAPAMAVSVGSKIWVMGGYDDNAQFISTVEMVDTASASPSFQLVKLANTQVITSLFAVGSDIYATHNDTTVSMLDTTKSQYDWVPLSARMLATRCFGSTAVVGTRVYAISGIDCLAGFPFPQLKTVEMIDFSQPNPSWQHYANLTDFHSSGSAVGTYIQIRS